MHVQIFVYVLNRKLRNSDKYTQAHAHTQIYTYWHLVYRDITDNANNSIASISSPKRVQTHENLVAKSEC